MLQDKIEAIRQQLKELQAATADDAEAARIKYLSRKGLVTALFDEFKEVPAELKRELGKSLNDLKTQAQARIEELKAQAAGAADNNKPTIAADLTRPATALPVGGRHPISIVRGEIVDIFARLGFAVADGPEVEDDWHVFSALNFPPEHPARDMQDTFFINRDPDILLRTHTSSVQVREMERRKPPIRAIFPGRVFRNEAISARAHCIFHQVEGLYIDRDVSFADLKQALLYFAREMFGESVQIRLRPSYFPFTEPSAEMDVSCTLCGGKGCPVCKGSGWLEILGCGMVDPNVLTNNGIDPHTHTGYAFGMGIERIAMLKYGIDDIRLFFENDQRFLAQFRTAL